MRLWVWIVQTIGEFCQNTPPPNQNLLKPLCLLGFEQGGVFVNTPPTLHHHPTIGHWVECWWGDGGEFEQHPTYGISSV